MATQLLYVTCLVLGLLVGAIQGYQTYQNQIPNGPEVPHPCLDNYMWPGVGHRNRLGGGELNVFGQHFKMFGKWNETICSMDSDGDGMTNGEELGDPNCKWSSGDMPEKTTGLSHPGICDPFDSPECEGKNDFVSCEMEEFNCPKLSEPNVKSEKLQFTDHEVPNTETNYYCMTFDLPDDREYHIMATEPIVDNSELLHHILLYGCQEGAMENPYPTECGMENDESEKCNILVGLWSVGLPGVCYDGVGFRFGSVGFNRLKMEIHYNNPMLKDGEKDASGMTIYYQPATDDVQDMVTVWTGTVHLELPPGEPSYAVTSYFRGPCMSSRVYKPAKIWGAFNHMHYLGISMRIELFREGSKVGDITYDENYSYDSPYLHRNEFDLLPGDEIKTTCVYNTYYKDHIVRFGDATSDEMCFGFIFAYPSDAFSNDPYLLSFGPIDTCELYTGIPFQTSVGTCNWGAFQYFTEDYTPPWAVNVGKYCSDSGECWEKCKETVQALYQTEPCLHQEAALLVNLVMMQSSERMMYMARLNTCRGVILYDMDGDGGDGGDDMCTWDDCQQYCPEPTSVYDGGSNLTASCTVTLTLGLFILVLMFTRKL